jgi:hypothetical protein
MHFLLWKLQCANNLARLRLHWLWLMRQQLSAARSEGCLSTLALLVSAPSLFALLCSYVTARRLETAQLSERFSALAVPC